MAKQIRAFIAVKFVATPALERVISRLMKMGRPVKAVTSDRLHVTLKFLGDTDEERLPEIGRILQDAIEDEVTIRLQIKGTGAFPRIERPSVVWVGLQQADALVRIQKRLETALEPFGFARESREFQPHLTLARIKARPPQELAELLQEHESTDFGAMEIRSIELYQSELRPDGPRYSVLHSCPLVAEDRDT